MKCLRLVVVAPYWFRRSMTLAPMGGSGCVVTTGRLSLPVVEAHCEDCHHSNQRVEIAFRCWAELQLLSVFLGDQNLGTPLRFGTEPTPSMQFEWAISQLHPALYRSLFNV
jgi:hypothetical protein